MCGIVASFGFGSDEALLGRMAGVIRHRGPDDTGLWARDGLGLGNQRLSIIDLAGGNQPFISDDGLVAVVQNGEIYNYRELAAELAGTPFACRSGSDTEVLLRLYLKEGLGFLSRLNGMFAFAVADRRDGSLTVVRDRLGVKPLYVTQHGGRVLFGSEIKCLLAAGVPATPDLLALHHFLSLNYVPPPFTAFAGIRHVPPGSWLRVDHAGMTSGTWWELPSAPERQQSEALWIEEFNAILAAATDIRLRADVPFGAFLSGGVDSSSVVGHMARILKAQGKGPVKTFTIGFADPRFDESAWARQAAERFGTDHVCEQVEADMIGLWPLMTWHNDQPHGDVSFMPTYRVSQVAAKHVKMVLTGDGGDELFAGYDKHRDFFTPEAAALDDDEFRRRYYESITLFRTAAKHDLYAGSMRTATAGDDSFALVDALMERSRGLDRINRALYVDTVLLLPGNNLVKPDRMGMAASIEARSPFLDVRMVELAFRMPGALKLKDGVTKALFKKAVEPLIGHDLAYRKKQMFTVPVGEWFKDRLRPLVEEVLGDPRTRARGLFEPAAVDGLVSRHLSGQANHTREIRALLAVELWFRTCIDQQFTAAPTMADLGIRSVV